MAAALRPYRDATWVASSYDLHVKECWAGIARAVDRYSVYLLYWWYQLYEYKSTTCTSIVLGRDCTCG